MLSVISDFCGILSLILTFFTLVATMSVKSQVLHSYERHNFKANYKQIVGKLEGYILSLSDDQLNSVSFYQQIDLYMTDLFSKYTFLKKAIKRKSKAISKYICESGETELSQIYLAKQLTELKNLISKEAHL